MLSKEALLKWDPTTTIPTIRTEGESSIVSDRKAYLTLLRKVQQGPLGIVNLKNESAVIDFIADNLLSSVDVIKSFQLVYKAACMVAGKKDDVLENGEITKDSLKLVTDNLLSICVNRMPRRNNGTLLHEASFEGAEYLVCFIAEVMAKDKRMIDSVDGDKETEVMAKDKLMINSVDGDKKTSLFRAQEGGHMDICKILLDQGASQTIKAKTAPVISIISNTFWGDARILDPPSQGIVESEYGDGIKYVVGFLGAVVDISKKSVGCVMYEVEVEKEKTFGHPLRIGWMSDQRILQWQGRGKFNKVKEVGNEEGTIAIDRHTRGCVISGSVIDYESSPQDIEKFNLDGYSNCDLIKNGKVSSKAFQLESSSGDFGIIYTDNQRCFSNDGYVYERDEAGPNIVFGAAIDCSSKRIFFAANGVWREVEKADCDRLLFSSTLPGDKKMLFPAVSCTCGSVRIKFNIGDREFKHPIPQELLGSISNPSRPISDLCEVAVVVDAAVRKHVNIFKVLVQRSTREDRLIDSVNASTGDTLMHYLSGFDDYESLHKLIELFPDEELISAINAKQNYKGETALMVAYRKNSQKFIELISSSKLVSSGGLQLKSNYGMTALMWACDGGHSQLVQSLIDNQLVSSADLQLQDNYGRTALMFACAEGHSQVVKSLIDNKLVSSDDLQLKDNDGMTALNYAEAFGHSQIVRSLNSLTYN